MDACHHLPDHLFRYDPSPATVRLLRARAHVVRCTRCETLGLLYHLPGESRDIDWDFFPKGTIAAFRKAAKDWNEDVAGVASDAVSAGS